MLISTDRNQNYKPFEYFSVKIIDEKGTIKINPGAIYLFYGKPKSLKYIFSEKDTVPEKYGNGGVHEGQTNPHFTKCVNFEAEINQYIPPKFNASLKMGGDKPYVSDDGKEEDDPDRGEYGAVSELLNIPLENKSGVKPGDMLYLTLGLKKNKNLIKLHGMVNDSAASHYGYAELNRYDYTVSFHEYKVLSPGLDEINKTPLELLNERPGEPKIVAILIATFYEDKGLLKVKQTHAGVYFLPRISNLFDKPD